MIGGWGEEKKRSRSIFLGVFFIDVLCRGWIGEWIGVGLRVLSVIKVTLIFVYSSTLRILLKAKG